MPSILNNVTTENEYSEKNTCKGGPAVVVEAFIYNEPVFLQIKESATNQSGQANWTRELYLPPQQIQFWRNGIFDARVRSAVEGKPAQVTLVLIPMEEHPITSLLMGIRRSLGGH